MNPFHERLARIGLTAGSSYGLALAGGYAVQAHANIERPSEDVDLFTAWHRRDEFADAVAAVIAAYEADGLQVRADSSRPIDTFARLFISDGREESKVELAVDFRAQQPVTMAVGPVLHPDDAAANKMGALFGRAEARDFIDIDSVLQSRLFGREELLRLAAGADGGFDRRMFADALAMAERLPDRDFARYEVYGRQLADLRARFADWRAELLA